MIKRSLFCLCILFIGSILIFNSAYALMLSFSPDTQTVSEGEEPSVDVTIDTGGVILVGYDIIVEYDCSILSIANSQVSLRQKLGTLTLDDPYVDVSFTDQIYISGSYNGVDEIIQSPLLNLATLNFLAIGGGTSDLKFTYITLYDESGSEYTPDLVGEICRDGSITVSANQTVPEPATFLLLGTLLVGFCFFKRKEI